MTKDISDFDQADKKIMVAMSGGVDSSVTAYLCDRSVPECAGAMMNLLPGLNSSDLSDAKNVADKLGMPFFEFDCVNQFRDSVIRHFVDSYEKGDTPNPCIECNRTMKFGIFRKMAMSHGYSKVATGHYAIIEFNEDSGRYLLKKAKDNSKDQSYFLYSLSQEQLENTLFPLGELTKSDVRKIADEQGFGNSEKKESQDICFVPDGDYGHFIEGYSGAESIPGDFVDLAGNVLGTHKGIIRYTIGQRKGLGLALPKPMYVCGKDIANNKVILCSNEELFQDKLTANNINLISVDKIREPLKVKAKIRYNQVEQPATATQTGEDELQIVFDVPQRAIAKGQSVVMYNDDIVVGGGIIR